MPQEIKEAEQQTPAAKPRKKWPWILACLLLLALAGIGGGGFWLLTAPAAPFQEEPVRFMVTKGGTVKTIARDLRAAGLLNQELAFTLAARLRGTAGAMKAGEYSIRPGISAWELARLLEEGRTNLYPVILPEGFTMAQIIERLSSAGTRLNSAGQAEQTEPIVDKDLALMLVRDPGFIAALGIDAPSLEGYLFPDTYFFSAERGQSASVLRRLVAEFEKQWQSLNLCAVNQSLSRHQLVTLASIIEKETGQDAERPLVSAVYHNRLRLGMPLQADPTVVYGLPQNGPITRSQLTRDHPYNTYTRPGLPPGPICSPGLASLRAACAPAKVDYLYFVATGQPDGSHNFAKTHAQHLRNVSAYRASQGRP